MSIVSNGKLIVAAIASRPYVEAAVRAGFEVIAIDAFADADVQKLATHCYQVGFSEGQLDCKQLFNALDDIDLKHDLKQFVGFCYGGGFEKTPNTLSVINERVTVLGNSAEVVQACKEPAIFFERCEQLQLPFPTVMYERPDDSDQWMRKEIGGSGGEHVRMVSDMSDEVLEDVYYQQFQTGIAISCLFLASDNGVEVFGFSELLVDRNDHASFRYGGAVSNVELSEQASERFAHYVTKLSQTMGLVGMNSCDAICDGDAVYLLEVNPRLSATISLYADALLMEKHIAASQYKDYKSDMKPKRIGSVSKAHQVVYAAHSLTVNDEVVWPEWVCDVPALGSSFGVGMPICTVVAEAEIASLAKLMVNERALAIKRKLLN